MFSDLALDRPEQVVTADNPRAVDNPPALQRVFNAAIAHNATELHGAFADDSGNPSLVMDEGAGFLVCLTDSAGLGRMDAAEAQDPYNDYMRETLDPEPVCCPSR